MWDFHFGFPCVRVAINKHNFPNGHGFHGKHGSPLLYLSCRRLGSRFEWRYVDLETGEQRTSHSKGWEPGRYLAECSEPLGRT